MGEHMPKYVIEREIPGAGDFSRDQLKDISKTSCTVLRELGYEIQWIESFVTTDKIYCIYRAPDDKLIREHAALGGFPVNRVSELSSMIDPSTAEI
jgi:Protein of unknown function (DUF4242)